MFAPYALAEAPQGAVRVWDEATITELVYEVAEEKGLTKAKAREMVETIRCESEFDPGVQSRHIRKDGTREKSYGLSQIHIPSWPEVKIEQAKDPIFAVTFMAKRFKEGKEDRWTCHRKLYGSK